MKIYPDESYSIFTMSTLFVICNGAKSTQDVYDAINMTYGGRHPVIKSVAPLKTDKYGNTFTFVDVYSGGPLQHSRMDRLLQQLYADTKNRGERFTYQTRPNYIEWTIKLHLLTKPTVRPDMNQVPTFR